MSTATAGTIDVVQNVYHGCIVTSVPVKKPVVEKGVRLDDGWEHVVLCRVNHDAGPDETEIWEPLQERPFLTLGQAIAAARQFKDREKEIRLHTPLAAEAATDVETETLDSPVTDHSADVGDVEHDAT